MVAKQNKKSVPLLFAVAMAAVVFCLSANAFGQSAVAPFVSQIKLPQDELPHPKVGVEWWYYSGHLVDDSGKRYGVMASFFVFGVGNMPKMHFAIFQLAEKDARVFRPVSVIEKDMVKTVKSIIGGLSPDIKAKLPQDMLDDEKIKRLNVLMDGKPIVNKNRLAIRYGAQEFEKTSEGPDWRSWAYRTKLDGGGFKLGMNMKPTRGPMIVGGTGNVGVDVDMFYYSITRMDATGTLDIDGRAVPVHGTIWYDHQFGEFNKDGGPIGWDWFCVQLEDGTDMNISALRDPYTNARSKRLATVQRADGSQTVVTDVVIESKSTWTSPDTNFTYPSGWILGIPSLAARIEIDPDFPEQEMRTFGPLQAIWEGTGSASAVIDGKLLKGNGYTELVGYNVGPGK